MSIYAYVAKDSNGAPREGTVDARSLEVASNLLRNQGLYIIQINEKRNSLADQISNLRGIPTSDVVAFTRQFSTMVSAGLPLARALEVLAAQTPNKAFKKIVYDILRYVEGGASLSAAMARYPNVFSTTYRSLVGAGETSGKLDDILARLAQNLEDERELSAKFKSAMIYPSIVFVAMIGVFIILMAFVVPKLSNMYDSLDVQLPLVTRYMIIVSDFMAANILLVFLGLIGGFIGVKLFFNTLAGRAFKTKLLYNLPIFGRINRQKDFTSFSRTLSLLMNSAIPIVEALETVGEVVQYGALKDSTFKAARAVEKGTSLSSFFKSDPVFPPLLGQMAGVGEETGQMDEVLSRVATYYAGEVDHLVKGLSSALEPVILVMLGGMVGFLIISIITPIYKITSAL